MMSAVLCRLSSAFGFPMAVTLLAAFVALMTPGKSLCADSPSSSGQRLETSVSAPVPASALPQRIKEQQDIFDLYEMQQELEKTATTSPQTMEAIKARQTELLAKAKAPRTITSGLILLAFKYKMLGPGQYRIYFLLQPKEDIKANYHFYVSGYVDPYHRSHIPDVWKQTGYMVWDFAPKPPSATWKQGSLIFLTRDVAADAIPYNIQFLLQSREQGRVPKEGAFDMGWWADLGASR